jgi:hypothetical protein
MASSGGSGACCKDGGIILRIAQLAFKLSLEMQFSFHFRFMGKRNIGAPGSAHGGEWWTATRAPGGLEAFVISSYPLILA